MRLMVDEDGTFRFQAMHQHEMKIAAIVHVFYPVLWAELARALHNFDSYGLDVYVTVPTDAPPSTVEMVRQDFPASTVVALENRGFDIGPFLEMLSRIDLCAYDFIVKLHTKRNRFGIVNFMPMFGGQWRRRLLSFCRTRHDVETCYHIFNENPDVGMIGAGALIVDESDDHSWDFVGGTMFIARACLFATIRNCVELNTFEPTERTQTASLAHEWERRLGRFVYESGMTIAAWPERSLLFSLTLPFRRLVYSMCVMAKCVIANWCMKISG